MSTTKPTKTLEQITQDVLNSPFGLTDDDLVALFADTPNPEAELSATSSVPPSTETVTEQTSAGAEEPNETQQAQQQSAPSVLPASQPDASTARSNVSELEAIIKAQQEQIAKMQAALQEITKRTLSQQKTQATETPSVPPVLDEISDQQIIERPKESIVKLVNGMLKTVIPAAFAEYDAALSKRAAMEAFRQAHPDFDELRPLMRQIVLEDPATNNNPDALPFVYEEAKRRRAAYLASLKKELGVAQPSSPQPASVPSEEELLAKLEQRIAEKLKRRKASAGAASPTSQPVLPPDRMTQQAKEVQKSEADVLLEAMLKAANPAQEFLRNVDVIKK